MNLKLDLSPEERADFWRRMRVPVITFAVLMGLLFVNIALGALMPFPSLWIVELGVAFVMIVTVLLFSMEVLHEPPLMRLFSILGFCWVGILFAMTMIDYLTR